MKACWLVKSEPSVYPWRQMEAEGETDWTGVRNYQARNNLRAMKKGDPAFFYHSGEGKEIVGIVRVTEPFHPDPTDKSGAFGAVGLAAVKSLKHAVSLAAMKAEPRLKNLALLRQPRLSVSPVSAEEWDIICALGK